MAVCYSYSYSEIITGVTPNAAGTGLTWSMPSVLPQESGLTVNGVLYRYSTVKNPQDDLSVTIRNENPIDGGYTFSHTDNWNQLPGNTITRAVPVNDIPIQYWGNGEITTEGSGQVVNPNVVYSYRYDTCYDPLTDPRCPGYADAMADYLKKYGLLDRSVELYDPLADENVTKAIDNKTEVKEEEEKEKNKDEDKEEKDKKRKEIGLAAADATVNNAIDVTQNAMITAMSIVPKFESYYTSIQGGAYSDAQAYKPTQLPENKKAMRVGLAQQLLHNKMVDDQYNR